MTAGRAYVVTTVSGKEYTTETDPRLDLFAVWIPARDDQGRAVRIRLTAVEAVSETAVPVRTGRREVKRGRTEGPPSRPPEA